MYRNVPVGIQTTVPVTLPLSADGADTLWRVLGTAAGFPISVRFDYDYNVLYPGAHYRITANTQKVYDFFSVNVKARASYFGLVGAQARYQRGRAANSPAAARYRSGCRCATCRTTPATATPAPPGATTTPATASTAPPPTPSPRTSADQAKPGGGDSPCSHHIIQGTVARRRLVRRASSRTGGRDVRRTVGPLQKRIGRELGPRAHTGRSGRGCPVRATTSASPSSLSPVGRRCGG